MGEQKQSVFGTGNEPQTYCKSTLYIYIIMWTKHHNIQKWNRNVNIHLIMLLIDEYRASDGNGDSEGTLSKLKEAAALTILGIKEKHKLSQLATQAVIDGMTTFTQVSYLSVVGLQKKNHPFTLTHCSVSLLVFCGMLAYHRHIHM